MPSEQSMQEAYDEGSLEDWLSDGTKNQNEIMLKLQGERELLHQVFVQNNAGAKLLEKWVEALMMAPSIQPESTQFEAALVEGSKNFVRNILIAIKQVEDS